MTDVTEIVDTVMDEVEPGTTKEQAAAAEAEKPTKAKKEPHACLCQTFEVRDPEDADAVFNTGCTQTTQATFAQGHDARLVSFLVDAHFDRYQLVQVVDGKDRVFATPAAAVADVSNALQTKAEKATENRQTKITARADAQAAREKLKADKKAAKEKAAAEKAAAKAAAPKATGAEVVAGSVEGDATEGVTRIKVGRYEYDATVNEDGSADYIDGKGEPQTVERDGYRLLNA